MNQEMPPKEVPNWMLYDLIDRRFNEVDRRFEEVDRKFEEMDKKFETRFSLLEAGMWKLEAKVEENTKCINELYLNRDKLKLTFSNAFALGTGLFSGIIAF